MPGGSVLGGLCKVNLMCPNTSLLKRARHLLSGWMKKIVREPPDSWQRQWNILLISLNGTPEDKVLRCSSMLFDEYCTRATRFGNLSPSSLVQVPSLLQQKIQAIVSLHGQLLTILNSVPHEVHIFHCNQLVSFYKWSSHRMEILCESIQVVFDDAPLPMSVFGIPWGHGKTITDPPHSRCSLSLSEASLHVCTLQFVHKIEWDDELGEPVCGFSLCSHTWIGPASLPMLLEPETGLNWLSPKM